MGQRDMSQYDDSKIVILPIAFQGTTTYGKGTKNAPKAILKASLYVEPFDEETLFDLDKVGVHTLKVQNFPDKASGERAVFESHKITEQILHDRKFPVLIGGEHTISIGSIQATSEKYPNLSILQLDAHTDLDKAYEGKEFSHASMAHKTLELTNGKVKFTQVGIRSIIPELIFKAKNSKVTIFYAHNIINRKHKINDIIKTLRKNVYITIDIDAFDPSVFPNTGTPEPNGLKWQYVINLIKEVSKQRNVVCLDLVEHISHSTKRPHHSDFAAAKLLHKVLCFIWKNKT